VEPTGIVLAVVQSSDRIFIARRSEQVGTSRGLWSVVMGYVERGVEPADQAWTEIREELGLQPPDVWLVRHGASQTLISPVSAKLFLVYPFLFGCAADCVVTLNWEHTQMAWVHPSRLDDADCVPWQRDVVVTLLAQS
jgi:8-oxo-dGTP diphosphatase